MSGARRNLNVLFNEMSPNIQPQEIVENQENLVYEAIMEQDTAEATRRWNYDFVRDCPLEGGQWQWELINPTPEQEPEPTSSEQQASEHHDNKADATAEDPMPPEREEGGGQDN